MPTQARKLAILNNVKVDRKGIVAVCEYRTHDVWGNARDGYEVNDSCSHGEIRIPVQVTVSNFPRLPGAADAYRSFPDSGSFSCEVMVSFELTDRAIRKALGISCAIETDGDSQQITINRARDSYPLADLAVIRYEEDGGSDTEETPE